MAKANEGVDQSKIKDDAQKLAGGGNKAESVADDLVGTTAGTQHQAPPITPANATGDQIPAPVAAPAPASAGQAAARVGPTPTPATATSAVAQEPAPPLTNGSLGAMKPGAFENATGDDAEIVRKHGRDYVRAQKDAQEGKPAQETIFSRRAWDLLGPNKEGWKPTVTVPKEVQELEEKKSGVRSAKG